MNAEYIEIPFKTPQVLSDGHTEFVACVVVVKLGPSFAGVVTSAAVVDIDIVVVSSGNTAVGVGRTVEFNNLYSFFIYIKQEDHGPHHSPAKTFQINEDIQEERSLYYNINWVRK